MPEGLRARTLVITDQLSGAAFEGADGTTPAPPTWPALNLLRPLRPETPNQVIRLYNFDVTTVLHTQGKPKDGLWFGVELEVEVTRHGGLDEDATSALQALGEHFALAKHDGSLTYGFELVTAPATVEIHRERWQAFFKAAVDLPLAARDTCGMHVHMTRKAFTEDQIGCMAAMVGEPRNKGFFAAVAGRESPDYAVLRKKDRECVRHGRCGYCADYPRHNRRYDALNILNKRTIELRIFASTLKYRRFMTNLEFTAALADFVRTRRPAVWHWETLAKWIGTTGNKYPALAASLPALLNGQATTGLAAAHTTAP